MNMISVKLGSSNTKWVFSEIAADNNTMQKAYLSVMSCQTASCLTRTRHVVSETKIGSHLKDKKYHYKDSHRKQFSLI